MPPTVLVVDDDPHVRDLLNSVLTRAGYYVEQATDGMAALDHIATHAPDLVLTDVQMPRLDGIGLASRLAGQAAAIPVIVMSAECVPPENPVPFIFRPFALPTVLELINYLLPKGNAVSTRASEVKNGPIPSSGAISYTRHQARASSKVMP